MMDAEMGQLPLMIAVVGADGSGKSTLGNAVLEWLSSRQPAVLCHLGKQTGNVGRAIARLPMLGRRADHVIARKAGTARDEQGPDLLTAMVIYAFSMRRVRRFKRMLASRAKGLLIVTDRFPQVGVPGPMDGLGLANARHGVLVRMLARRERRHYEWMASHRPDLVLRLNVDLETAILRKPDHRASSLAAKVRDVPKLTFGGAPIVDIDTSLPLAAVVDQAKRAITELLERRAGTKS